jgi:hypothetical protein
MNDPVYCLFCYRLPIDMKKQKKSFVLLVFSLMKVMVTKLTIAFDRYIPSNLLLVGFFSQNISYIYQHKYNSYI